MFFFSVRMRECGLRTGGTYDGLLFALYSLPRDRGKETARECV